jgi:hypothetical protein
MAALKLGQTLKAHLDRLVPHALPVSVTLSFARMVWILGRAPVAIRFGLLFSFLCRRTLCRARLKLSRLLDGFAEALGRNGGRLVHTLVTVELDCLSTSRRNAMFV